MGALIALGCTRSGDVVVVIDSSMRADSLEVVAVSANPGAAAGSGDHVPGATSDSVSRLRLLDDSAATLDARFRELRGAVGGEVAAIDTMDRRTRAYATRYDAIMRRTRDAERLRALRDSVRRRADALRTRLGARAIPIGAAPASRSTTADADGDGDRRIERRPIRGETLTLSLAPGAWWIGIARIGTEPARYDSVTVRKGTTDTLDLRRHRLQPHPDGR